MACSKSILGMFAILASLALAMPSWCYDFPLSQNATRDAYFLGARPAGLTPRLLKQYSHWVWELRQGSCTTQVRLETPFLQVADYTSKVPDYSSQDAVKEFYDKPMNLRIFLYICYMREAPPPYSVKLKVIQDKKQITPASDTRLFYAEPVSELANLPPNGEKVKLEFDAAKIDSSTLTFRLIRRTDNMRLPNSICKASDSVRQVGSVALALWRAEQNPSGSPVSTWARFFFERDSGSGPE